MRSLVLALVFCTGCAFFEPGTDPVTGAPTPAPADVAIAAAKENYESNPLRDFGPYGAAIAAALALVYGGKRGYDAYKAKRTPA